MRRSAALPRLLLLSSLLGPLLLGGCQTTEIPFLMPATKPAVAPPATAAAPPTRPGAASPPASSLPAAPEVAAESLPAAGPRPVKAALLLPLTGPSAKVGNSLFNAAQLALFDVGVRDFTLIPMDTGGTPEGAGEAARQAVAQGVDILLGPLFASAVQAAAPAARGSRTSMIAFSTDRTVAGDGVYVLGFLPRPQVARIVGFARSQGRARFAALAPDNEYGRAIVAEMREVVPAMGGVLTRAAFYDPRSGDFSPAVERLVAGLPRRPVEPPPPGASEPERPVEPPLIADFDAMLIPDDGSRLRNVAAVLPFHGIDLDEVKLLGTMLWDDPGLGSEPALVGGWFPAAPPQAHAEFVRGYAEAFGARPPAIASLAYDATALAAVLGGQRPPDFSAASLTASSGFSGVDGIFRLLPDGTSERGLAVMEVARGGPRQVSPAPVTFEAPIY